MSEESMSEANPKTRLCAVGDLPPDGGVGEFSIGNRIFCVAKINGQVAVLDNECPHHGGPLGQGMLEDGKVVCPWHAYAFDLKTGGCTHQPKIAVKVYGVKIEGNDVLVAL